MLTQRFSARCSRPVTSSRRTLIVRADGAGYSSGAFQEGMKVKVVSPITLYSVPKHPEGINIENMEGLVFKDVTHFKGKVLSANLPIVVKFVTEFNGAPVKFQAHLGEDEIKAV